MHDIALTDGPLAIEALDAYPPEGGGECLFVGRTRIETHEVHGRLARLEYEAFRPMAETQLAEIAAETQSRYGVRSLRVRHALGAVAPGEASVIVQVVCPHRAEAFDACRFVIDALKSRVPIWKREVWTDGTTWSAGTPVGSDV